MFQHFPVNRSDVIRTRDLCVPNAALYQTEPRFDMCSTNDIIYKKESNVNKKIKKNQVFCERKERFFLWGSKKKILYIYFKDKKQERRYMSGYRRFIAYVYEYEAGKKGESRGFIKVEAKDSVCRMNYKLTGIYGQEAVPAKIYAYVRENGECIAFLLGTCDLSGMRVEFETEMPENNIGGSGHALGDLCGLILQADSGEVYGSIWEEQPVALHEIRFPKACQENKSKKEALALEEALEAEKVSGMQAAEVLEQAQEEKNVSEQEDRQIQGVPKEENTGEREEQERLSRERWEEEREKEESESVGREQEAESFPEKRVEDQREAEEVSETVRWEEEENISEAGMVREEKRMPDKELEREREIPGAIMSGEEEREWEQREKEPLLRGKTSFCDNGITQCRRISPGDFRLLNRKDRGLLTNRFLRHGFSRYGHLLIGKREEDGKYILGVPGIYESQEALMAGMFGFPYFKETGGQNSHSRHFGYWYRIIEKPEEIL